MFFYITVEEILTQTNR